MLLQGETGWTAPPPYSAGMPSVLKGQKQAMFFYRSILSGMTKCLDRNGIACFKIPYKLQKITKFNGFPKI